MNRNAHAHLTQEEFVGFVLEDLRKDELALVSAHLQSCERCTTDIEAFEARFSAFPAKEWNRRRQDFEKSLKAILQQTNTITIRPTRHKGNRVSFATAATEASKVTEIERLSEPVASFSFSFTIAIDRRLDLITKLGTVQVVAREEPTYLLINFASHATELEGAELVLEVELLGSFRATLRKNGKGQIGACFMMPIVDCPCRCSAIITASVTRLWGKGEPNLGRVSTSVKKLG